MCPAGYAGEKRAGPCRARRRAGCRRVDPCAGRQRRSTRSRRRPGCWRTIPASTPGAAAYLPMTAMSNWTPRSWTGATAMPAPSPGSARRAPRSALARAVMEQSPHVLLTLRGRRRFRLRARAGAGRQPLVRHARAPAPARRAAGRAAGSSTPTSNMERSARSRSTARPCRRRHLDRRADRQALGPDRRFAVDRRRHLCRRPRRPRSARPGSGEYFIRAAAAHEIARGSGSAAQRCRQALDAVLAEVKALGGNGGLIVVAPVGEAAWGFTTPGMYRGMAGPDGRPVGDLR